MQLFVSHSTAPSVYVIGSFNFPSPRSNKRMTGCI